MTERKKKRRKRRKTNIINIHHVSYEPEIVAYLYSGEHYIITQLERRTKNVSQGFIDCLKLWIECNEHKAKDLTDEFEERPTWRTL